MRVIVAGSRGFDDYSLLKSTLERHSEQISTLISGNAKGADKLGERWAVDNNIPVERYIPEWDKYGRKAGHIRNSQMAQNADALIVFWDGKSKGTANMIENAEVWGLEILEIAICR